MGGSFGAHLGGNELAERGSSAAASGVQSLGKGMMNASANRKESKEKAARQEKEDVAAIKMTRIQHGDEAAQVLASSKGYDVDKNGDVTKKKPQSPSKSEDKNAGGNKPSGSTGGNKPSGGGSEGPTKKA
jgi:hypothetical protein